MDRDAEIRGMVCDLTDRFPLLPTATVERLVRRLFDEFDGAPVQTYVAVLVRRAAERTLAGVEHLPVPEQPDKRSLRQPA